MSEEASRAYLEGALGDFREMDGVLARLGAHGTTEARAWAMALGALCRHAGRPGGALPRMGEVAKLAQASAAARVAGSLACAEAEKACLLSFDAGALGSWLDVHARIGNGLGADVSLRLDVGATWLAALTGEEAGAQADTIGRAAAVAKSGALVIQTTALRALVAMSAGDLAGATTLARRASRMARTEGIPQEEYLANVVLARARRLGGKPHMAARILGALLRVAPACWHGWIVWELLLAAGPTAVEGSGARLDPAPVGPGIENRSVASSIALGRLLSAALAGDRRAFRAEAAACETAISGWPALAAELPPLLVALDPDADPATAAPDVRAWCTGESGILPAPLLGLGPHAEREVAGDSSVAFVVARPGRPARRVLGSGVLLAGTRPPDAKRRPGRNEATISALALAGPAGLPKVDLFRAVYGFPYSPPLHQGVFDVLLHRVRTQLGELGTLARDGDRLSLDVRRPFVIADPRTGPATDDQVLRVLAQKGAGTAKQAADALQIPLRTAQAALQQLVSEGVCILERRGRHVEYRVEDTTFSEPTRH